MATINRKEFHAIAHGYVKDIYMDSCGGGLSSSIDKADFMEAKKHINSWIRDLLRVKKFINDLETAYKEEHKDDNDIYM